MLGLWDSGFGGLTIAAAIQKQIPNLSFLYRADHKNAPYGGRSPEEILALVKAEMNVMFEAGCTLVVLACNTASASALRDMQQNWLQTAWPGRNVIGVVVPVIEEMIEMMPDLEVRPAAPIVHVFATDHTVRSQVFVTEVYKRAPGVRVMQTACSELAPAIDRGADAATLHKIVDQYVQVAKSNSPRTDYVVLGCTHYPLVRHMFADDFPDTPILDQAHAVAHRLENYLRRHPEYHMDRSGKHIYTTTGNVVAVNAAAHDRFMQMEIADEFIAA